MDRVPLYDTDMGEMRVAALMSGSGTNLRRILEHERSTRRCAYRVVVIFTDRKGSAAAAIGADFDLPVICRDIDAFYAARHRSRRDLTIRPEFDEATVRALSPYRVVAAAYAGYMSIVTPVLTDAYLGVNVHPSDLGIESGGKRRFVGDHAVRDAIAAGQKTIAASTHLVENEVDGGRLLLVSRPVKVKLPKGADLTDREVLRRAEEENQERLKREGDWVIFPRTLSLLAEGRFSVGEKGRLYFDGEPIEKGLRMGVDID